MRSWTDNSVSWNLTVICALSERTKVGCTRKTTQNPTHDYVMMHAHPISSSTKFCQYNYMAIYVDIRWHTYVLFLYIY